MSDPRATFPTTSRAPGTPVYSYFEAWSRDGAWERIYEALHRRWRKWQGREETPSAGSIDSQNGSLTIRVKTTEAGGELPTRASG